MIDNKYRSFSFQITSSVDCPSQSTEGIYFHPEIKSFNTFRTGDHELYRINKFSCVFNYGQDLKKATKIALEFRERIIALFALTAMNDVSTDDVIVFESPNESFSMSLPSGMGKMSQYNSLADLGIDLDKLKIRTKEEWNAIKRFKKACMQSSDYERVTALTGTIDILGQLFYPSPYVGKRIKDYLNKRLKLPEEIVNNIYSTRNFNEHKHDLTRFNEKMFLKVRNLVAYDLGQLFGMKVSISPKLRVGFRGIKKLSTLSNDAS